MVVIQVIVAWDRRTMRTDSAFRYLRKLFRTQGVTSDKFGVDFGQFYELQEITIQLCKAIRLEEKGKAERGTAMGSVCFCNTDEFNRAVDDGSGSRHIRDNVFVFMKESKRNRSFDYSEYEKYCEERGISPYDADKKPHIPQENRNRIRKALPAPSVPPSSKFLKQVKNYLQEKVSSHLELLQSAISAQLKSFHSHPLSPEAEALAGDAGKLSGDLISRTAEVYQGRIAGQMQEIQESTTERLGTISAIEEKVSKQMKGLESDQLLKEVAIMNEGLEELKRVSDMSQFRATVEQLEAQEAWLSTAIDKSHPPSFFPIKLVLANLSGHPCILIQYKTYQDGQTPLPVWLQTTPEQWLIEDNTVYLNKAVTIFPLQLEVLYDLTLSVLRMDGVRLVKNELKIRSGQFGEAVDWEADVETFRAEQMEYKATWHQCNAAMEQA